MGPGYSWFFRLCTHITSSCPNSDPSVSIKSSAGQLLICSSPSLHGYCWTSTLHLAFLNLMSLSWTHFSNLCRSLWMLSCPLEVSPHPLSFVSPANLLRVNSTPSFTSLTSSPSTNLWGLHLPLISICTSGCWPVLLHWIVYPYLSNSERRILERTQSNALQEPDR